MAAPRRTRAPAATASVPKVSNPDIEQRAGSHALRRGGRRRRLGRRRGGGLFQRQRRKIIGLFQRGGKTGRGLVRLRDMGGLEPDLGLAGGLLGGDQGGADLHAPTLTKQG